MRTSQVNMAVAQPTKTKSAPKAAHNAAANKKSQMHRRSRTGLWIFYSIVLWCCSSSYRLYVPTRPPPLYWSYFCFLGHFVCLLCTLSRVSTANIIAS